MTDENETKPQPMSEIDKARLLYYEKGARFFSIMIAIIIIGFLLLIAAAIIGGCIYFGASSTVMKILGAIFAVLLGGLVYYMGTQRR